ncbi:N-6 DNA methylase [Streptomyces cellulosae]
MRLTRSQAKNHELAMELVDADRDLTFEEKEFVLDHYQPSASTRQALDGAFFTPRSLARTLAAHDIGCDRPGERIIDLGAGIGHLAFETFHDRDRELLNLPLYEIVCVEKNPEYVRVGRRVLPEARWIEGDLLDVPDMGLGEFDIAISNPPFGAIPRSRDAAAYRPRQFEYHAIVTAARVAKRGVFIVPRDSVHGAEPSERTAAYKRFTQATGIRLNRWWGDADEWIDEWGSVRPRVTVTTFDRPETMRAAA